MGGKQHMGLVTRGVVLLMLKLGVLGGSSHFELLVFVRGMLVFCNIFSCSSFDSLYIQGFFFHWYPPKKLKYGKPRLGESTLT